MVLASVRRINGKLKYPIIITATLTEEQMMMLSLRFSRTLREYWHFFSRANFAHSVSAW
jgi:hypothetical protein